MCHRVTDRLRCRGVAAPPGFLVSLSVDPDQRARHGNFGRVFRARDVNQSAFGREVEEYREIEHRRQFHVFFRYGNGWARDFKCAGVEGRGHQRPFLHVDEVAGWVVAIAGTAPSTKNFTSPVSKVRAAIRISLHGKAGYGSEKYALPTRQDNWGYGHEKPMGLHEGLIHEVLDGTAGSGNALQTLSHSR